MQANFEHGILRIELPKAEAVKPRKITVSAVSQTDGAPAITQDAEQSRAVNA